MHCNILATTRVDPMFFKNTCAAHVHTVFGVNTFRPVINRRHLRRSLNGETVRTTCASNADHSLYWFPSLYIKDNEGMNNLFNPFKMTVYYKDQAKKVGTPIVRDEDKLTMPPLNFHMLVDASAKKLTSNYPGNHRWVCKGKSANGGNTVVNGKSHWDSLKGYGDKCNILMVRIPFAGCVKNFENPNVDGVPTDKKTGLCPKGWYRIPEIQLNLEWNIADQPCDWDDCIDRLILSDGKKGDEIHANFIFGWNNAVLADAMENCQFRPGAASGDDCPLLRSLGPGAQKVNGKLGRDRTPMFEETFPDEEIERVPKLVLDTNSDCPM